jgi:hypothetical protein
LAGTWRTCATGAPTKEGGVHGLLLGLDFPKSLFQFCFTRRLLLTRCFVLRYEMRNHGVLLIPVVLLKQRDVGLGQLVGGDQVPRVLGSQGPVDLLLALHAGVGDLGLRRLPISHAGLILEPAEVGQAFFRVSGSDHVLRDGMCLTDPFCSRLLNLPHLLLLSGHELRLPVACYFLRGDVPLVADTLKLGLMREDGWVNLLFRGRSGCILGRTRRLSLLRTSWRVVSGWRFGLLRLRFLRLLRVEPTPR